MANPNPETEHLKPHQFLQQGSEPLAAKPIGLRFPRSIDELLRAMPGDEKTRFIRAAVMEKLERESKKT